MANSTFGGFRNLWVMVMFDLPTDTKSDRYQYGKFRKSLLKDGFVMLQYSVLPDTVPAMKMLKFIAKESKEHFPRKGKCSF